MKNIHWLVPFKINHNHEILNTNIASIRLRSGLFTLPYFKYFKVTFNEDISNVNDIDYLFINKPREDLINKWLEIIINHRKNNKKLFFDYTDHHLIRQNFLSDFYRKTIKENDHIITSSNKLKKNIKNFKNFKNITVIEDILEIDLQKIKKNNQNSTFLFFGQPSNLQYLFNLIPTWDNSKEYSLIIQTSLEGLKIIQEKSRFIQKPNNLNINLQLWSIENMLKASEIVSGVIIPGDINDERKNGVSHNRLITAFALGLPVAASRYESYLEFDNQFVDIDNKSEFENFLKNPSLYSNGVEISQKKVKNYTQDNIAKKWLNLTK